MAFSSSTDETGTCVSLSTMTLCGHASHYVRAFHHISVFLSLQHSELGKRSKKMFHARDSFVAARLQRGRESYYTICGARATPNARECLVSATILHNGPMRGAVRAAIGQSGYCLRWA